MPYRKTVEQRVRELKASSELLAEQLPRLRGKALRDADRELRALDMAVLQQEAGLPSAPSKVSSFSSKSDRDSRAA